MPKPDYVPVAPELETFRGYAVALDKELDASGSIAIPFIAFAKMSGADVDKPYVKEDFEKFLDETATEYGATIKKHHIYPDAFFAEDQSGKF